MGGALWRLKFAHQADAYQKVVLLLAKRIRKKHEVASLMQLVAEIALKEHLDPLCRPCGGRGAVADENGVRRVCGACGGSGARLWSDVARMRALGVSPRAYGKLERKFALAHEKLADADLSAGRDVAAKLGDIRGMMRYGSELALLRDRGIIPPSGPAHNQNSRPEPTACSTSGA